MALLYFLPVLVALAFLLAHAARGGTLGVRASSRQVVFALSAILALTVVGALVAYAVSSAH